MCGETKFMPGCAASATLTAEGSGRPYWLSQHILVYEMLVCLRVDQIGQFLVNYWHCPRKNMLSLSLIDEDADCLWPCHSPLTGCSPSSALVPLVLCSQHSNQWSCWIRSGSHFLDSETSLSSMLILSYSTNPSNGLCDSCSLSYLCALLFALPSSHPCLWSSCSSDLLDTCPSQHFLQPCPGLQGSSPWCLMFILFRSSLRSQALSESFAGIVCV